MQTRKAFIDLGTNVFHLLIAEYAPQQAPQKLIDERIGVKIGEGGISQGLIVEAAQVRIYEALEQFALRLKSYEIVPEEATVVATSAFRNAQNATQIIGNIQQKTRFQVQIISGDEEALLIYKGVNNALKIGENTALLMDIGGGSVEFSLANAQKIFWKQSFEIGAQRLLDAFFTQDPISTENIQQINNYLEDVLKPLWAATRIHSPSQLVGSSGTFETLVEIHSLRTNGYFDNNLSSSFLSKAEFEHIYDDIIAKNRQERLQTQGIIPVRADMIVVALIMLKYIVEKFQFRGIRISFFALKEGLMYQAKENMP
ncbi:MAG: phosphatase [Cytophagales bacterium]|nr:MAG: phosphatase [Cytophagales bacterium]